ncbi:MAG TPA: DEAD/DEAH box helicase [Methylomirabilota bacterium]|jgi:ATP-dependent RNA helicase RhlE|nr:DEAD/DEAH box helicase [Methylomirabilota bacterium]
MVPPTNTSFEGLGIAPKLFQILQQLKFTVPTPIQFQSIPIAVEGKDVMGIAQTGTGKTLAFGIPMIQRLAQQKGRGLVILPTRELALQVDESLHKIGKFLGLKTAVLIGGESMPRQIRALRQNPHIIIGTPGRLNDHLEQKTLDLSMVNILVLDEADRMLDMGFEPQIRRILAKIPKTRQTMLFSATMPDAIVKIATSYMTLPIRIEVARAGTTAKDVAQEVFFVPRDKKVSLLSQVLKEHTGSILVFTRTKFTAKKIAHSVRNLGHTASEIHSNRSLSQRREALDGFKIGKYRVLVATDIAARGIDVTGIELVINYDLPENPEDYVHRIGRTGRAGLAGKAVSFATPDQRFDVRSIERLIRTTLPIKNLPELAAVPTEPYAPRREFRPSRRPENRPTFRQDSPRPTHRHSYMRDHDQKNSRSSRPGFKTPGKFKSHDRFSKPNPNRPVDQGFDANHRPASSYNPNRISYPDDQNSY